VRLEACFCGNSYNCFSILSEIDNIGRDDVDKVKVHPITCHEDTEGEYGCNSTLSLTSALDGGGWSMPRPGRFTPAEETRYPLYRRLCGPQGRSGWVLKTSPPSGILTPKRPTRIESLSRLRYPGAPKDYVERCYLQHKN
jgi:hypothetical protein